MKENNTNDEEVTMSNTSKIISACFGSITTTLIVTPLDHVKVRLQATPLKMDSFVVNKPLEFSFANANYYNNDKSSPYSQHGRRKVACCQYQPLVSRWIDEVEMLQRHHSNMLNSRQSIEQVKFTGVIDAFIKISKNEGIFNLWKGLIPTFVMSIPATVIYYVGYETLKDHFIENYSRRTIFHDYAPMFAGAAARTAAVIAISPIELMRTRMQAKPSSSMRGTFKELQSIAERKGIGFFWRGVSPTLWRDVPFSAIYWFGYEKLKSVFLSRNSQYPPYLISFLCGATSGMLAAIATIPFDVAKTRQQAFFGSLHRNNNSKIQSKYISFPSHSRLSTLGMLKHIWRSEGIHGLTAGMSARLAKVSPACGVMIGSYELGKHYLSQ